MSTPKQHPTNGHAQPTITLCSCTGRGGGGTNYHLVFMYGGGQLPPRVHVWVGGGGGPTTTSCSCTGGGGGGGGGGQLSPRVHVRGGGGPTITSCSCMGGPTITSCSCTGGQLPPRVHVWANHPIHEHEVIVGPPYMNTKHEVIVGPPLLGVTFNYMTVYIFPICELVTNYYKEKVISQGTRLKLQMN